MLKLIEGDPSKIVAEGSDEVIFVGSIDACNAFLEGIEYVKNKQQEEDRMNEANT